MMEIAPLLPIILTMLIFTCVASYHLYKERQKRILNDQLHKFEERFSDLIGDLNNKEHPFRSLSYSFERVNISAREFCKAAAGMQDRSGFNKNGDNNE